MCFRLSDTFGIQLLHFYIVSVPPRVRPKPADGNIVVKKGTEVTLECSASGNPVPTITWSREVRIGSDTFDFWKDYK